MNSISAVNTGYWSVQGGPAAAGLPAWKDSGPLNLQVPTSFSSYLKPDGDPPPLPDLPSKNPAVDSGENIDSGSKETQQTQQTQQTDSISSLLGTNTDGEITADKLKSATDSIINNYVQSKDQDGDQTLNAQEAGLPQGAFSKLDTNGDGTLSVDELTTAGNKVIDGLVSLLDTNGDQALSADELAVFNLFFPGNSFSQASTGETDPGVLSTSGGNSGKSVLYGSPIVGNSDLKSVLHWTV
jgi:hypothetical protein